MVRTRIASALGCLLVSAAILWPPAALAQHRYYGGYYGPPVRFSIGIGFWYPYGGFYPFYAGFYPYGFYPYGFYPYWGYPYAPYWFDDSSDLRIQVTPRDAEVYVDGHLAGRVDSFDGMFQRLHVEPGGHEILIYHERYRPIVEKLYLSPREGYKIQRAMEPLGAGDPAPPRPTPSQPPEQLTPSRAGRYMPPPNPGASGFGSLSIRVQPADAEVFVDGERWVSPDTGDRIVIELGEGTHRVELRKDGHEPYATDVRVRAGDTMTLNVSLPKK
jgi:hypothetical protein